jgi:hypothetical protein
VEELQADLEGYRNMGRRLTRTKKFRNPAGLGEVKQLCLGSP